MIDDKGAQKPMSGIRLAAHLRERERASPRLLVRALEDPQSITALPDQQAGERTLPAVSIKTRAGTYTVLFDRTTHLPAVVRTRDADNVYGDSNYDLVLSDWKDVGGGAKRAHTLSFQLNGVEVQRLTLKQVTVDAPIPADTFAVSDEVKAKAKTAAGDVPYQWVLRRMFLGRFLDSDKVYYPEGGGFKLAELAPNVQHVVGGGANNLIVAMKDGIVIFDAPVDEGQSRWVIDAAKAKYPGKPIKQLVLTHHHMDHTGGTRAYVAEGAEIVIPGQARPFFEKMFQAEHKLAPDALARQPKPAKIVDVKDTMSLKDETIEIKLYNIPNPHADGMIIGHVVGPNLVWVTDLISPRGPIGRTPNTVAVGDALRKTHASPDRRSWAVTAPPPSRRRSRPRWRRTDQPPTRKIPRRPARAGRRGFFFWSGAARLRLRLELGVPVEIVEPALVQIVRREQPAVAVQVRARSAGTASATATCCASAGVMLPLLQIAGRAGGDHVAPGRVAAARARQQMVEGEVVARAAILAGEAVAQEHVEPREGRMASTASRRS